MKSRLRRALGAFGYFWWDFLVGDTPEFALATGVIIALAFLLEDRRLAATIVLPLLTAIFLLASTYRGRQPVADRLAEPETTPDPSPPPPPPPPPPVTRIQ